MMLNKKTLDCELSRGLMFDYIDGVLAPSDKQRLEAHLEGCEACRRELKERREMLALVASAAYSAPSSLYSSVMAEVEKTPQDAKILAPKLRIKPWMGSIAAVAAAVMILVVGRGLLSQSTEMLDNEPGDARSYFDASPVPGEDGDAIDTGATGQGKVYYEENLYGSASEDRIIETTYSYAGYAPSASDAHGASYDTVAPIEVEATAGKSLLDTVFDVLECEDTALIICYKSDVAGVIPMEQATTIAVDGVECEHYLIDTDAMVKFTGYLELFENSRFEYRACVPMEAEFEKCEIILVVGGDADED